MLVFSTVVNRHVSNQSLQVANSVLDLVNEGGRCGKWLFRVGILAEPAHGPRSVCGHDGFKRAENSKRVVE